MTEPLILPAERPENILAMVAILREGGVGIIPTETVYGLSASVFQSAAVERIFAIKQRQQEARVPVLLATAADLPVLVKDVPPAAWRLIDALWPGPLTLVLPARDIAPEAITRGGGTVAVRVPANKACLQLLQALGEPVVGTSANISGRPPATTATEAIEQLGNKVDAVLVDQGVRAGIASTVVEIANGVPIVHRVGGVKVEHIRGLLGVSAQLREQLTGDSKGR